jgi:uncharacterized protein YxjI
VRPEERFRSPVYVLRRKVLRLFGGAFHITTPDGALALFSEMKSFRLREDIRIYTDETMSEEMLAIRTPRVLDFSAAYDVVVSATGEKVGVLKRRGVKSLVRDQWLISDAAGAEIGLIQEESAALAAVRRVVSLTLLIIPFAEFLPNMLPQRYIVTVGETPVAAFSQNFNPFVSRLHLDFSADEAGLLDRRLGIAAAVLLCAVEGRQA